MLRVFNNAKQRNNQTCSDYVEHLENRRQILKQFDNYISEDAMKAHLLLTVNQRVKRKLRGYNILTSSLNDIKDHLQQIDEEIEEEVHEQVRTPHAFNSKRKLHAGDRSERRQRAHPISSSRDPINSSRDPMSKKPKTQGNKELECFHCGEKGHIRPFCPQAKNSPNKPVPVMAIPGETFEDDAGLSSEQEQFELPGDNDDYVPEDFDGDYSD